MNRVVRSLQARDEGPVRFRGYFGHLNPVSIRASVRGRFLIFVFERAVFYFLSCYFSVRV